MTKARSRCNARFGGRTAGGLLTMTGVVSLALLAGCGGTEHEDLKQWMTESSRDLKASAPPLPELRPFPVASYTAADRIDPFSTGRLEPDKKEGVDINKPDFDRPREQLENFPLSAINYVGLLSKTAKGDKHALVRAEGALYQVGIGNYMGENFGRIVAIDETGIKLIETVQDPSGRTAAWVEREIDLHLMGGVLGKEDGK